MRSCTILTCRAKAQVAIAYSIEGTQWDGKKFWVRNVCGMCFDMEIRQRLDAFEHNHKPLFVTDPLPAVFGAPRAWARLPQGLLAIIHLKERPCVT